MYKSMSKNVVCYAVHADHTVVHTVCFCSIDGFRRDKKMHEKPFSVSSYVSGGEKI